ncbi:MAG TPA: TolC family protein [Burkholderiaceae bacterium]|nr:TolC family protein [Burkholderiaceae bacterium]
MPQPIPPRVGALAALLLALAGCAAPVEVPAPSLAPPAAWSLDLPYAQGEAPGTDAWWREFGSAELDTLIASALQANRDLHIAAARVAQARAGAGAADAERLPQLGLAAGVRQGRDSSADPKASAASGGFRASWEADLFGAKGLASAAASHDADSADLAQQAMRIAVAAEVATAYFEVRTLARREAISRDAVATLERQVEVARHRFAAGQSSALDIDRLVAELRQEKAGAVQLQGARQGRLRQLAMLAGAPQPDLTLGQASQEDPGLAAPAALLPAELLERRPDVRQQARAVEAAAARLGVAKRDLYPRLQLDWAGRQERLSIEGASASPALVVGYGLAVLLPVFDGGRIRANIALHEARAREAMAAYEKAMLAALADAEAALVQWAAADSSVTELEQAVRSSADASQRSGRMFEAGLVGLDAVLDVRRSHQRTQDALLQARGARWAAAVAVRRAFAGRV